MGRQTQILNVRLPTELYEEFVEEAGPGYGARSDLLRRMLRAYFNSADARKWEERYRQERNRRMLAEAKLTKIVEIAGENNG